MWCDGRCEPGELIFDGSVKYGMLLWFEMSSSLFRRGSMIGGPSPGLVGYVERGTDPWRSRCFRSAKRKLTRILRNVTTRLRLYYFTEVLGLFHLAKGICDFM